MKSVSLLVLSVILAVAQAQVLTAEDKAKVEAARSSCQSSSGASAEQIAKTKKGEFGNEAEMQKYMGCMLKTLGVLNDKGNLQVKVLRSKVPKDMDKDEAMKLFLSCKDKKGGNIDETAYLLYKCFWESTPRRLSLDGQ